MMQTMEDAPGVGLAGPQVYVPLRMFVFRVPAERASADPNARGVPNTVLINPEIEPIGDEIGLSWEGCLSIPEMRAVVPRAVRIRYRGFDCDGNVVEGEATRFHARVMQHENDHLDGILYPMRVTDFRYFGFNAELDRAAEEQRQRAGARQRKSARRSGPAMIRPPERLPERDAAIEAMLPNVPFDGWTIRALRSGLAASGMPEDEAPILFPGGAADMIAVFCDLADRRMIEAAALIEI